MVRFGTETGKPKHPDADCTHEHKSPDLQEETAKGWQVESIRYFVWSKCKSSPPLSKLQRCSDTLGVGSLI